MFTKPFPVIYLLEATGEASGVTYRFCSEACRAEFRADSASEPFIEEPTADGTEAYCNDGEVCCQCCQPLKASAKP